MSKFHERFRLLKENSGRTQAKIAADLNVTPQALSYYLNGREPSYDLLVKMAQYFNVSADYMLGLSDSRLSENTPLVNTLGLTEAAIEKIKELNQFYSVLACKASKPDKKEFYSQFIPTISKLICTKNFKSFIARMAYYSVPTLREDDIRRMKLYQDEDDEPHFDDVHMYYNAMRSRVQDELGVILNELFEQSAEGGDPNGHNNNSR